VTNHILPDPHAAPSPEIESPSATLTRRGFVRSGVAGLAAAVAPLTLTSNVSAATPDGTPEQII
jgi:hypothetical protein